MGLGLGLGDPGLGGPGSGGQGGTGGLGAPGIGAGLVLGAGDVGFDMADFGSFGDLSMIPAGAVGPGRIKLEFKG